MGKNLTQYHHNSASNGSKPLSQTKSHGGSSRRIWVKRIGGNPTTISVGPVDLIDDVKTEILKKFPNSLARRCDPSDIRIMLILHHGDKISASRRYKLSKTSLSGRLKTESSDDNLIQPSNLTPGSAIVLEPDQNVWEFLDDHFTGPMAMSDAFLIDVDDKRVPDKVSISYGVRGDIDDASSANLEKFHIPQTMGQSRHSPSEANNQYHTPRTHQPTPIRQGSADKYRSASPNLSARSPPSHLASKHKRSISNPPQSPISSLGQQSRSSIAQAVLLLPKNFSLGEQHTLKRMTEGGHTTPRNLSSTEPKDDVDKSKAEGDGTSSASQELTQSLDSQRHHASGERQNGAMSRTHTDIATSASHSAQQVNSTSRSSQDSVQVPLESKGNDDVQSQVPKVKQKETTINTNTFEKVLPKISVLVVEDNSINQAILGAFLRKHKIHYQIAKNGQEAVDKWRKGGFHLVLMDIQLPVKSGIEATKEIRHLEKVNRIGVFAQREIASSTHDLRKIKEEEKLDLMIFRSPVIIVALTASSNSSIDKKNALTAGCNDFLTKPVNLVWLQNKITEWGCMQALIDFDAWRVKGDSQNPTSSRMVSNDSRAEKDSRRKPTTAP